MCRAPLHKGSIIPRSFRGLRSLIDLQESVRKGMSQKPTVPGSGVDSKRVFRNGWDQTAPRKERGRQSPNPSPVSTETRLQIQSTYDVCGSGGWQETGAHLESRSTPK